MDQAFLASYLIGLREGLEATLVVSILIAYLVKSDRRRQLPPVWLGVAVAVALSVGFGGLLTFTQTSVLSDFRSRELFEAITSVIAVALVTWMIFWMRRTARALKGQLQGKLEQAVGLGTAAVAGLAFVSVVREGLETALLFFSAVQGATTSTAPLLAIAAGLLTAIAIGFGLYAGAVRINLGTFFTWSGVALIFVAAGIFKYGIHDFQEAEVLPGLNTLAFDISGTLDPNSWYGAALAGMFNITAAPSVLEMIAYLGYLIPVLAFFLWPRATKPAPARTNAPEPVATAAAPAVSRT
ncbi:MAG: FTR1 family protein [Geodermatophilaceae bacterium]|nr:FTR1 family protein [Geodermatophilaceae bacterium]